MFTQEPTKMPWGEIVADFLDSEIQFPFFNLFFESAGETCLFVSCSRDIHLQTGQ